MQSIVPILHPLKLDRFSIQNILITILIHSTQYFPKTSSTKLLVFIQHAIQSSTTNFHFNLVKEIKHFDFELYRFFLNSIEQVSCIEDLFELMDKSQNLLYDRRENDHWEGEEESIFRLERESYFGLILRRFIIQFEELMFDDLSIVMDQWNEFKKDLEFKISFYNSDEIEVFLHTLGLDIENNKQSMNQEYLESENKEINIYGINTTATNSNHVNESNTIQIGDAILDFDNIIREIEKHFPNIPKIHYLKYLNAMKEKNWNEALDSLHRYFDYFHTITGNEQSNAQSIIASFAGLNLTALYYHFGYYESAVYAIKETIRIAQQKGEEECVSLSLVWLFRLENKNPAVGASQETMKLVRKCIDRCRNLGLPHALVETLLFSAQIMMSKRTEPYDNRTTSEIKNQLPSKLEHVLKEAKLTLTEFNLDSSILQTTETTFSAIWREIGIKELSNVYLSNEFKNGSEESKLVTLVHNAHNLLNNGEIVKSLEKLASFSGNVIKNDYWNKHVYDILFEYNLRRNVISKAKTLISLMKRIASSEDFEYRTMIMWREARLELQLNNTRESTKIIENAIDICKRLNLDSNLTYLLYVDAQIKLRSKLQLQCINSVLEGITICEKRSLLLNLCRFKMLLTEIHIIRDSIFESSKILKEITPFILENGSEEDIGNILILSAKLYKDIRMTEEAFKAFQKIEHYHGMLQSLQLKYSLSHEVFSKEDEKNLIIIHSTLEYNSFNEKNVQLKMSEVASEVLKFEIQEAIYNVSQSFHVNK